MHYDWRPLVTSRDGKYNVKGTELAVAIVGSMSRFALYEVRCIEADRCLGVRYHVRDAHTVSDADVREGKRPVVTGRGQTPEEALEAAGAII